MRKEINLLETSVDTEDFSQEELQEGLQDELANKTQGTPQDKLEEMLDQKLEEKLAFQEPDLASKELPKPDLFKEMLEKLKESPETLPPLPTGGPIIPIKKIVEALLFASESPLSFQKIREVLESFTPIKPRELRDALESIASDLEKEDRPYRLIPIAQGYQLRSAPEYSRYIDQLFRNRRGEKLSPASLEVLAIIAYRQPITRIQIENIRGVDSSGVVHSLLERGLIEATGRLEAPGRPTLYGTAKDFLVHFGLKDLSDLPTASIAE
ncbi:MAG: hypothetical protein K0S07_250 [Chlamydiales bacterium]|jgi:segregation and condensation protein B|nr:hypothetical protein [Chlamydiales bacterium]